MAPGRARRRSKPHDGLRRGEHLDVRQRSVGCQLEIQAAVNACPVGQLVQLSAWTFTVNNYVLINKGITLRGAGPTATILQKTNGAIAGVDHGAADNQPIVVVGPNRWPKPNDATSQSLVANGARGATSVAVEEHT